MLEGHALRRLHLGPIDFALRPGECVSVAGKSGAGKSVLQISRGWGDAVPAFTRPGFFFFCPSTVPQKPSSLARDRRCRTTAHRGGGRSRALVCRPGLFCFLSPVATRITVSPGWLNSSFICHNSANYGPAPPSTTTTPREEVSHRRMPTVTSVRALGVFSGCLRTANPIGRLSSGPLTMRPAGTFPRQASSVPLARGIVPWQ